MTTFDRQQPLKTVAAGREPGAVMSLPFDLRENVIEAIAQIIDPAEWDFCDGNGRKKHINSVPRWQRQVWCKRSMEKARKIVRLLEPGRGR